MGFSDCGKKFRTRRDAVIGFLTHMCISLFAKELCLVISI